MFSEIWLRFGDVARVFSEIWFGDVARVFKVVLAMFVCVCV